MLVVLSLGDPAGAERAEGGEGGGTSPDSVLAVRGGDDPDLGAGGGESLDLLLQALGDALVHGGTTGEDDVLEKISADIHIRFLNGLPGESMDSFARLAIELRGLHTELTWDGDLSLVGEFVDLVKGGGSLSG